MGGKDSDNYERFCDVACKAFNLVRANARILISLFRMMVSTGIITKMGAKTIIAASIAGGARDARLIPERRGWAPLGGAAGGGSSALD